MTLFTTKASFVKRLLASILDWVAVFIIAMPVLLLYLFPLGYANMQELATYLMQSFHATDSAAASASTCDCPQRAVKGIAKPSNSDKQTNQSLSTQHKT